jgi:hypothetical protein
MCEKKLCPFTIKDIFSDIFTNKEVKEIELYTQHKSI